MPDITLDDETTAALTLFNEYVVADRERTQREKRVRKAERAKDEAAAAVKKLGDKASAEEKAEAEKAYHQALETWKALRDGKEPPKPEKAEKADDSGADAPEDEDAPTEEVTAETSAEEAPRADEASERATAAEPAHAGDSNAAADPADAGEEADTP